MGLRAWHRFRLRTYGNSCVYLSMAEAVTHILDAPTAVLERFCAQEERWDFVLAYACENNLVDRTLHISPISLEYAPLTSIASFEMVLLSCL